MTPNTPADVASLPAKWRGEKDLTSGDSALQYNAALDACALELERALTPAGEGGLPPERVEDDKDWEFIGRCMKECGAGSDEGEDGIFWMFNLAAMKKLRRLATTEQPNGSVQGESWKCEVYDRLRAQAQELGFTGMADALDYLSATRTASPPATAAEQGGVFPQMSLGDDPVFPEVKP